MTAPNIRTAAPLTVEAADLHVRRAAVPDLPDLVETLTVAFQPDPFMSWWIPDPERRWSILANCFELIADINLPYDELYLTDPAPVAAAVWIPPGCQPSGDHAEELVGWYVAAAEETADRLQSALQLMAEVHPEQPHAYLFLLATLPQWQSRGLGSALLRNMLQRCDRDGVPAYLEATSEDSRRLYLRHGFQATGEIRLPDGPSMWPMWRPPQPAL